MKTFIFRCPCGSEHRSEVPLVSWVRASREAGALGWRLVPLRPSVDFALRCPKCVPAEAA